MSTLNAAHQRQRQRARRRADAHRSRGLEPGQRRVDARPRRPAVPPPRRRAAPPTAETVRRRARPAPAPSASRSPASSRIRRRSSAATSRRIPTPTRDGFVAMPNVDVPEEMVDMLSASARLSGEPHRDRPDSRHWCSGRWSWGSKPWPCPLRPIGSVPAVAPASAAPRPRQRRDAGARLRRRARHACCTSVESTRRSDANTAVGQHARRHRRRARRDDRAAARRADAAAHRADAQQARAGVPGHHADAGLGRPATLLMMRPP